MTERDAELDAGIDRGGTCGNDDRDQDRIVTVDGEIIDVCQDCRWQREWDNRADQDVVEEMFNDE